MAAKLAISLLLFFLAKFGHSLDTPLQRFAPIDYKHYIKSSHSECYDREGLPQRCVPDFDNVAFTLPVHISRPEFTCGVRRPSKYCLQTGNNVAMRNRTCSVCDSRIPEQAHPPKLMTDFNRPDTESWWQSVTMEEGVHKQRVNLTLRLGKAFDIVYVNLKFASPRPESFVIYKRTRANDTWTPWQFYSGSCRSTFGLPEKAPIHPANEAMAQCTREFSDISPLTGGNIVFSTLGDRPSAENFEESEVLHKWVTATEIMISLVRLNTFGDDLWGDLRVLRTYFYAITDLAVGGWCKCNGHASQCVNSTGHGQVQLVCDCQHNTAGVDCQECAPFHVDRPWRPATSMEANECLACNCSGLSSRCFFDAKLFEATGHGGHCIDCAGNTEGIHCERCLPGHWRRPDESYCRPCDCDSTGSLHGECAEKDGKCPCKPGVGGQRCDQCLPGFFGFGSHGCRECQCDPSGSLDQQRCSPRDGTCTCKPNVEGTRCERCKPGYFLLSPDNSFGCSPCFCFGHSSVCSAADGFYALNISSDFLQDAEGWTARSTENGRPKSLTVEYVPEEKAICVAQECERSSYFLAPSKFLGDQRLSYGQFLRFSYRKSSPHAPWSKLDLQLVGANGRVLSLPFGVQGNAPPSQEVRHYQFRVHADPRLQWNPALREIDFIGTLSNLSEIRLRATYSNRDVGFLSHFSLGSAWKGLHPEAGIPRRHADWVEQCQCPPAFDGQFCERCALGHKRAHPFGGPLSSCVPCQCNGHGQECEPESGACKCRHNTAGDMCERCARGFFGDALSGRENDCKACGCPEGGPCLRMEDGTLLCTECPEGYSGPRCEYCAEEHFGEPQAGRTCQKCECHGNTDPNAIGQCDQSTGQCRRCIHHTTGWNCERCQPGYFGNATAEIKGDCRPCQCYAPGTQRTGAGIDLAGGEVLECAEKDGQCPCLPNVVGQRCADCAHGFFNISSGMGCQPCECDPLGSVDAGECDLHTGQCRCKPGVIGPKCDQCAPRHFAFSPSGCSACICHPKGAEADECDIRNGQCLCKDWVEGRQCDRCAENHFNLEGGCPPCDDCYALIQRRKAAIQEAVAEMGRQLEDFRALPIPLNDSSSFKASLQAIFGQLTSLQQQVGWQQNSHLVEQFNMAREQLKAAFGHLEGTGHLLVGMDEGLAQMEAKIGKWGGQKVSVQREIKDGLDKLELAGDELFKHVQKILRHRPSGLPALSKMAEEADELVHRQEGRSVKMREIAAKIAEQSAKAVAETEAAVFGAVNSSIPPELAQLRQATNQSLQELAITLQLAKETRADADLIRNKTAFILANAERIRVPKGGEEEEDEADILASLEDLKEEIGQISQELAEAKGRGKELEAKAREELDEANKALKEAKGRMEEVQEEFELASLLEQKALEASESADEAFLQAEATLRALEGQDPSKLDELKAEYETEVGQSKGLGRDLAKTEKRLKKAEIELKKVQKMAQRALRMALEAQEKAESVAKPLRELAENADKLETRLEMLKGQLTDLEEAIRVEELLNEERNEQIGEGGRRIEETLKEAAYNEQAALGLNSSLANNEKLLIVLNERLKSVSLTDDVELNQLEAKLVQLEMAYADSGVEKTQQRMRNSMAEKTKMREQIAHLQAELGQLKDIAEQLPTKCFNIVRIEQNGN